MTIAKAPLALDGVTTPSSLIRKGTFAATGGQAGVARGGSAWRVSATSPATTGLQVASGVATVLNGYQSVPNEAYVVANSGIQIIPTADMPPASATLAYWLVCLVVGDPGFTQGGHPFMPSTFDNAQLDTFQFNRIVILPCNANTASFDELGKTYPGLALARLAIPANTTTITDGMITDLRVSIGATSVLNSQPSYGMDRGNGVLFTDANGEAQVGFGRAFPAGYAPVVVASGGNGEVVMVKPDTIYNTGFRARFIYPGSGANIANGPVRIYWVAV